MNFFEIVSPYLAGLSKNDQELFDFVVKNMVEIRGKSIREVAAMAYVSSATFLRFVQKIGFSGYSEFSTVIKFTLLNQRAPEKQPFTVEQRDYRQEYLKNINESVRVIQAQKLEQVVNLLAQHPEVFFFANGVSKHITEYLYYLYTMAGFSVHFPRDHDYRRLAIHQVNSNSVVFILSYHGNDDEHITMLNDFHRAKVTPTIISVTQADNNIIQNLSDINFYMFTDNVFLNGSDITSHISMIAILELILYQYIENYGQRDFNFQGIQTKQ